MDLREIDARVHHKVFNHTVGKARDKPWATVKVHDGDWYYIPRKHVYHWVPKYTTDWNALNNLIEAAYDKWRCGIALEKLPPAFPKSNVVVIQGGRIAYDAADCKIAVYADTLPLAFCKAVLELKPLTNEEIAALESESGN